MSITDSLSPSTLSFAGAPLTATLTLTTGAASRTAAVGVEPSAWPDDRVQGSPLRVADQQISGAGHQTGGYAPGGGGSEVGASVCLRGGPVYAGGGIDLFLPARSTTTISWQVAFAAPPWLGQSTALGWVIGVPASARDSRLIAQRQIAPQPVQRIGPSGVQLRLRAGSQAEPAVRGALPYRRVPVGRPVQIIGTTQPRVGHARVQVGDISTANHHRSKIATVTTRADGGFTATWRPQRPGNYTITAALNRPPSGLLADRNCDLALTATRKPETQVLPKLSTAYR